MTRLLPAAQQRHGRWVEKIWSAPVGVVPVCVDLWLPVWLHALPFSRLAYLCRFVLANDVLDGLAAAGGFRGFVWARVGVFWGRGTVDVLEAVRFRFVP